MKLASRTGRSKLDRLQAPAKNMHSVLSVSIKQKCTEMVICKGNKIYQKQYLDQSIIIKLSIGIYKRRLNVGQFPSFYICYFESELKKDQLFPVPYKHTHARARANTHTHTNQHTQSEKYNDLDISGRNSCSIPMIHNNNGNGGRMVIWSGSCIQSDIMIYV